MHLLWKLLGIAGCLWIAGCSASGTDQLAAQYCDCFAPTYEARVALDRGLADSLPQEKITALADALVYARIAMKSCLQEAKIEQRTAGTPDSLLEQAMKKKCPDIYAHYAGEVAP